MNADEEESVLIWTTERAPISRRTRVLVFHRHQKSGRRGRGRTRVLRLSSTTQHEYNTWVFAAIQNIIESRQVNDPSASSAAAKDPTDKEL